MKTAVLAFCAFALAALGLGASIAAWCAIWNRDICATFAEIIVAALAWGGSIWAASCLCAEQDGTGFRSSPTYGLTRSGHHKTFDDSNPQRPEPDRNVDTFPPGL